MNKNLSHSLSDYIDLTLWNEFQESLSSILDISIALYNMDGTLCVPSTRGEKICELIEKRTTRGLELYRESYRRAIKRAVQPGEPYVYRCFTNQYIFVIPVTFDPHVTIAIVGGHVYLSEDNFNEFIERSGELGLDGIALSGLKKSVKIVHPQEFFTKPHVVKSITVPFLRSLFLKGYFEKGYYQMQSVFEATIPTQLPVSEDHIYRQVFNTLGVLFDVDTASLMTRPGDQDFTSRATFGRMRSLVAKWKASDSMPVVNRLLTSKKSESCKDIAELEKMGLEEEIWSLDIFPMLSWNNVSGLLCVFNTNLTRESVKLLSLLANQLSVVMEGSSYDSDVKRRFSGLELLQGIYESIPPVLDHKELYSAILNKSAELVGAEQGSLMMVDNKDQTLAVQATKGIDKRILEKVKVKVGEGISGKVIEKGTPILVQDIESECRSRKNRPRYKTGSFVSLPLKIESCTVGVINISDKITGEVFSDDDLNLLQSFACYASIALERGTYYRMTEELKKISVTDALTGLLNRRYFQERLFEEFERSKRQNKPFTLFIIDIDDFKVFNDRYGHLAGDEALKRVAHAIRDAVRSIDVVSRLGGEEFSAILPFTTKADAYVIAERIRKSVEEVRFMGTNVPPDQWLSISLGVAEFPADANTIDELFDRADKAMYLAKARGKNRIIEYGQ